MTMEVVERDGISAVEVAAMLGVGEMTVYRRARDGSLPCLRLGSRYVFSRSTISRMLETGNVAPVENDTP